MKSYIKYITGKLPWYLITFFTAVVLNFLLPRLIPGNPIAAIVNSLDTGMADTDAMKKIYQAYNSQFGLDKSIFEQFKIYFGNILQGNWGISFSQYPQGVSDIIKSALSWTLMLQLPAILVSWFIGNVLGALAAYLKGIFDKAIFPLFIFFSAIPPFALGIISIWIFATTLKWVPGSLAYSTNMIVNWKNTEFITSVWQHYQLPFWSIVVVSIGSESLGMREMSIYELNADYVKYSRLLGIGDRKIVSYVFRNAMLPQITGLALALGRMLGGSLIIEIVFSYPGLGSILYSAIQAKDYPLISGCTLVITITALVANFLVDVAYGLIDPRIKAVQE